MPVAKVEIRVFVRTGDQSEVERDFDQLIDSLLVRGIAIFDSSLTTTLVSDVDDSEEAILDLLGSGPKA